MKEAAGEANLTIITIVLLVIVVGAGTLIVNNMMTSTSNKSNNIENTNCTYNTTTKKYDCN